MSSKKSAGGSIMTAIAVGERLGKIVIQITIQVVKWLWQGGNWSHREYITLRTNSGNPPTATERILVAVAIFVLILVLLKYVFFH